MKLQRGNFTVNNIDELKNVESDSNGIKKVIDLAYMGEFEYERNTIPLLRMLIEYKRNDFDFYKIDKFDANGKQMIMFVSLNDPNNFESLHKIAEKDIDRNMSLYDYIKNPDKEFISNFWWNIECNYMIFFGEEKMDLINYFVDSCFKRDGKKEEIERKLKKARVL